MSCKWARVHGNFTPGHLVREMDKSASGWRASNLLAIGYMKGLAGFK